MVSSNNARNNQAVQHGGLDGGDELPDYLPNGLPNDPPNDPLDDLPNERPRLLRGVGYYVAPNEPIDNDGRELAQ
jgi:hypothetical protein